MKKDLRQLICDSLEQDREESERTYDLVIVRVLEELRMVYTLFRIKRPPLQFELSGLRSLFKDYEKGVVVKGVSALYSNERLLSRS